MFGLTPDVAESDVSSIDESTLLLQRASEFETLTLDQRKAAYTKLSAAEKLSKRQKRAAKRAVEGGSIIQPIVGEWLDPTELGAALFVSAAALTAAARQSTTRSWPNSKTLLRAATPTRWPSFAPKALTTWRRR